MEDVTDFDFHSPDYPPYIILEVKCSEAEMVSRFPGCKLTIIDHLNSKEIWYYRLPSSSSSANNSYQGI